MRTTISKLNILAVIFAALALVNCSKGGGSSSGGSSSTTCPANQLYTSAGCLPQCGTSMVWYNNSCVAQSSLIYSGGNTTCPTGQLNSQYGCQPQCGTNAVWYGNQCQPVTGTIGGLPGVPVGGGTNMCGGTCGAGMVQTYQGCMPQGSCGACYGYNNGWCYIGVNAHQYYGY